MPLFPKVQSPCPYKDQLSAVMDGDFCRMCQRRVFDLTALSDADRLAFLAGCEEEVCVSYRLPLRAAIAAAALASSAAAAPAAAQQPAAPVEAETESDFAVGEITIIVGGIKDPSDAEMVEVTQDRSVPDLPVVYEEEERHDAGPSSRTPVAELDYRIDRAGDSM